MISNNGVFFGSPVTIDGSITATSYVGLPPLTATQTDQSGTYSAGVLYTNSNSYPVYEEVSVNVTGPSGQAGSDNYAQIFVNGLLADQNGVWNACNGVCGVKAIVPAGATFEVVLTHVDGGGRPSLAKWLEVALG
jgi:hypothetical protein